eukprot:CAMPEP_0179430120 /NCGR_PEP_ID=MMETSP0799-20121207/15351_1 /TAXON_ID=46947 /ORGANISM="Geminigera cryophila, Strain CCMP2564" /LENGTH=240 /DNA_ID=CAMNT_0021206415 /DNA_START=120 /DNA_END=842 /DNA_ORIENTATION=-
MEKGHQQAEVSIAQSFVAQKNDSLIEAINTGSVSDVKRMLDLNAQIDVAANENGSRALHLAAHKGDKVLLDYLLTWKPDLEVTTHLMKLTPLHCAVNSKSHSCVKSLLDSGADFEAQTDTGERPLHMAILRMEVNILLTLIDVGADRQAPASDVWESEAPKTPIEMAQNLPAPLNEQIKSILTMSAQARTNYQKNQSGADRHKKLSDKIHVLGSRKEGVGGQGGYSKNLNTSSENTRNLC